MSETRPFLVAGDWRSGDETFDVTSPYDGSVVARVGSPSDRDVEDAVRTAEQAFGETRTLPVHARADALAHISRRISERVEEFAEAIAGAAVNASLSSGETVYVGSTEWEL